MARKKVLIPSVRSSRPSMSKPKWLEPDDWERVRLLAERKGYNDVGAFLAAIVGYVLENDADATDLRPAAPSAPPAS